MGVRKGVCRVRVSDWCFLECPYMHTHTCAYTQVFMKKLHAQEL